MQFGISSSSLAPHLIGNMDVPIYSSDQFPPNNQIANMHKYAGFSGNNVWGGSWVEKFGNWRMVSSNK